MSWALTGAVVEAAEGPAQPVTQADDRRARELWENGAILYSEGRYEDAIAAWTEAYRLSRRPIILTNLANAQERLGRWNDALDSLNRYRAFAVASEREALDRRIANIERRLAEQPTGSDPLVVPATPVAGSPGLGLPVALMLGGVVGLGVGAGSGFVALNAREDALALCLPSGEQVLCPSSASEALAFDRRFSLIADAAIGGGAVLIVAGAAALLRARQTPVAVVSPVPGGGILLLTGGF
jgi:tetratricopeptide (TPR) repeat protein